MIFSLNSKEKTLNRVIFFILLYTITMFLLVFYLGSNPWTFFASIFLTISGCSIGIKYLNKISVDFQGKMTEIKKENEFLKSKITTVEGNWDHLTNILSCTLLTINDKGLIVDIANNLFFNQLAKGTNFYEAFPKENLPEMRKAIGKTFSASLPNRFILKTTNAIDNSILWHDAIVTPVRSFEKVVAVNIVLIDITKYKNSQLEKEGLIAQLEKQKKELEQFSLSITHDLKSPLVTISGFVHMLKKDLLTMNRVQIDKDLFHITNAANRMQSLVDDLIKISQIGKLNYAYIKTPLSEVVEEAIRLVSGRIKANDVNVRIMPGLPVLKVDRRRMIEVFQNLLDNAIKYMGPQPHPSIEIGVKKKCGETICYVKDNGMGVDYRHQERIFSLFDKIDHASQGTGLGLAVAKCIIEKHNGLIWVESEGKGKGSMFCFIIPDK